MKQVPKHIKDKVERMSRLMERVVNLNEQVEDWLESSGVTDCGFDFTGDYRECRGYEIYDTNAFYEAIEEALGGKQ